MIVQRKALSPDVTFRIELLLAGLDVSTPASLYSDFTVQLADIERLARSTAELRDRAQLACVRSIAEARARSRRGDWANVREYLRRARSLCVGAARPLQLVGA